MAFGEFDLIETYFTHRLPQRDDVTVGIGDDGAVASVPEKSDLVVVTDTMVQGVHFDQDTPARAIGHKIVAVNLSDLAAMGAEPAWISLALTLPEINDEWLTGFAHGLREICDYYNCQLIGGDTTQGPLSITVTAHGFVPKGKAIRRSGAKPGDWLYVSGTLGDAGLALAARQHRQKLNPDYERRLTERLYFPSARVALGQSLRGIASSAIDVSDGLLADVGHILKASHVGVRISVDELPLSLAVTESLSAEQAITYALTSGDDYELLFTVPEAQRGLFDTVTAHSPSKPVCIGRITNEPELVQLRFGDEPWELPEGIAGFEHFRKTELSQ
ncbi:thiamine-phosphate kinase [Pseudidiomarina woesei]|uniref:Thiamine-monophosphate kinase n=1 Tax=Pseudidiomarina woesei TaxID=1381080 RepID=A0A0K6HA15_9GAMM|nr:thiamine-phosphate kinase [Pseudidiomarina woesei]CUA87736.1 thiamine-phosphate kinase [Pseudidiomarina woesei]